MEYNECVVDDRTFFELNKLIESAFNFDFKNQFERGGRGSNFIGLEFGISPTKTSNFPPSISHLPPISHPLISAILTIADSRPYTRPMPLPIGVQPELARERSLHAQFIQDEAARLLEAISITRSALSPALQSELIPLFTIQINFLKSEFKKVLVTDAKTYSFKQWEVLHGL